MQISRLFQIVYLLMEKKSLTAGELARRFEVSTRTIYRDVETLSSAGIPIYTNKGNGGGISLLEDFVIDKSVLTDQEQKEMLAALQGFQAVNPQQTNTLLLKLSSLFSKNTDNWIDVDFSNWDNNNQPFDLLKNAILSRQVIAFDYYGGNGEKTSRQILPLQLKFKHRSWYVWGFCRHRQAFRLFKLSRIKALSLVDEYFDPATLEKETALVDDGKTEASWDSATSLKQINISLKIHSSQAYRVFDEFEEEQVTRQGDGSYVVQFQYPEDEWVYGLILSYGNFAQVLEPEHLRGIIKGKLQGALELYD